MENTAINMRLLTLESINIMEQLKQHMSTLNERIVSVVERL